MRTGSRRHASTVEEKAVFICLQITPGLPVAGCAVLRSSRIVFASIYSAAPFAKIMPVERKRMRPWLEEKIESQCVSGLKWLDKEKKIFSISWKHAARHGWEMDKDASIFKEWAIHTEKFKPGVTEPDPKRWKANFRCAMNSLDDIMEVKDQSINKGSDAVRVYRMLQAVSKKRDKTTRTKDARKKNKKNDMEHSEIKPEDPRTNTSVEEKSMQENTVDSTERLADFPADHYGNITVVDWTTGEEIVVDSTNNGLYNLQVSPVHSSEFEDDSQMLFEVTKVLEQDQLQWQPSIVGGKGFISSEVGATDSSYTADSSYTDEQYELTFSAELNKTNMEAVGFMEPMSSNTQLNMQQICSY